MQRVLHYRRSWRYALSVSVLDKRTRNDPRRQATERALLEATQALLDEGASFADLSVTRIATSAGRTRTAFYAHFDDRRELLLALVQDAGADAIGALEPFLENRGPLTYEEVVASSRALLAAFRRNASLVRAIVEAAGYDEQVAARWSAIIDHIIAGSSQRLQAEGHDPDEAAAMATALVWMTERTCYQQVVRTDTNLDDEQTVAALSEVWWRAVQSRRPPDGPGTD